MGVGLKATSAFATGMAKLSTAVKLTAEQQAKLKQSFIETSDATGVAVEDTTELAYHWASAGVQADDLGKGSRCSLQVVGHRLYGCQFGQPVINRYDEQFRDDR